MDAPNAPSPGAGRSEFSAVVNPVGGRWISANVPWHAGPGQESGRANSQVQQERKNRRNTAAVSSAKPRTNAVRLHQAQDRANALQRGTLLFGALFIAAKACELPPGVGGPRCVLGLHAPCGRVRRFMGLLAQVRTRSTPDKCHGDKNFQWISKRLCARQSG